MTTATPADQILDVQGLNCPMPLLKAQMTIKTMDVGQVLKILSTDRGSIKDFQSWARTGKGIELVAQDEEPINGTTVFVHYVKRVK